MMVEYEDDGRSYEQGEGVMHTTMEMNFNYQ